MPDKYEEFIDDEISMDYHEIKTDTNLDILQQEQKSAPDIIGVDEDSEDELQTKLKNLDKLPEKSKVLYEKIYIEYEKWCKATNRPIENYPLETNLLIYFEHLSKDKKPSTLWSYYSMLKSTIRANHNVDISSYGKLIDFLKVKSEGFKPRKSNVLTLKQIETFLYEAPEDVHLMNMVAVIFAMAGACNREELLRLEFDDIKDLGTSWLITLRDANMEKSRVFSVTDNNKSILQICRRYAALRPTNMRIRRFFLTYRNERCTRQVVGKNVLAKIPKKVASYLKLSNPELYTWKSFRRLSLKLLSNGRLATFH